MTAHPHDHAHDRDHDHHHAPTSFGTAFAIGTALNLALVAAQLGYGLAAHSMALVADGAHNFGDALGLLLAWGATALGRRAPSPQRTYGWGRSSILAALINAVVLLVSVGAIALGAVQRLFDPAPVAGTTVIVVATAAILVNGITAWLFSRGHGDINIRGAFLHMAADAGVSAGVVVAALLIGLTGWLWLDPLASLLIVAVITFGSWRLLRQATNLAMDGVPESVPRAEVAAFLEALPGVAEVHDLHIWGLSTTEIALTAHLVRQPAGRDESLIEHATEELWLRFGIGHATLQLETPTLADICRLRSADVV